MSLPDEGTAAEDEGEDAPRSPRPRRHARAWTRSRLRLLSKLMFVYGVALIVGTLALWYTEQPASSGAVPCSLGLLPPTQSSSLGSLNVTTTSYPPPANGSVGALGLELWVNTSQGILPGTIAGVAVHAIGGDPDAGACTLPVPDSAWTSTPSPFYIGAEGHYTANLTGDPSAPYSRSGVFAVLVSVNLTNTAGTLGSTHALLFVG